MEFTDAERDLIERGLKLVEWNARARARESLLAQVTAKHEQTAADARVLLDRIEADRG